MTLITAWLNPRVQSMTYNGADGEAGGALIPTGDDGTDVQSAELVTV